MNPTETELYQKCPRLNKNRQLFTEQDVLDALFVKGIRDQVVANRDDGWSIETAIWSWADIHTDYEEPNWQQEIKHLMKVVKFRYDNALSLFNVADLSISDSFVSSAESATVEVFRGGKVHYAFLKSKLFSLEQIAEIYCLETAHLLALIYRQGLGTKQQHGEFWLSVSEIERCIAYRELAPEATLALTGHIMGVPYIVTVYPWRAKLRFLMETIQQDTSLLRALVYTRLTEMSFEVSKQGTLFGVGNDILHTVVEKWVNEFITRSSTWSFVYRNVV